MESKKTYPLCVYLEDKQNKEMALILNKMAQKDDLWSGAMLFLAYYVASDVVEEKSVLGYSTRPKTFAKYNFIRAFDGLLYTSTFTPTKNDTVNRYLPCILLCGFIALGVFEVMYSCVYKKMIE